MRNWKKLQLLIVKATVFIPNNQMGNWQKLQLSFTLFVSGCSGRNFGDDPRRQRRQLLRRASKPHSCHEEPGKLKLSLIKLEFTRKRNRVSKFLSSNPNSREKETLSIIALKASVLLWVRVKF
jgi:hypothetical protein